MRNSIFDTPFGVTREEALQDIRAISQFSLHRNLMNERVIKLIKNVQESDMGGDNNAQWLEAIEAAADGINKQVIEFLEEDQNSNEKEKEEQKSSDDESEKQTKQKKKSSKGGHRGKKKGKKQSKINPKQDKDEDQDEELNEDEEEELNEQEQKEAELQLTPLRYGMGKGPFAGMGTGWRRGLTIEQIDQKRKEKQIQIQLNQQNQQNDKKKNKSEMVKDDENKENEENSEEKDKVKEKETQQEDIKKEKEKSAMNKDISINLDTQKLLRQQQQDKKILDSHVLEIPVDLLRVGDRVSIWEARTSQKSKLNNKSNSSKGNGGSNQIQQEDEQQSNSDENEEQQPTSGKQKTAEVWTGIKTRNQHKSFVKSSSKGFIKGIITAIIPAGVIVESPDGSSHSVDRRKLDDGTVRLFPAS
ncbi:MAG: hypothetical protein EZS28_018111 [Streblomastix strix]|uniref:Uncharacterized protein n=1 Tax=Streblomastix strix TaxID=222440 RepID=A0A5J4VUL0_9EUKA|nr:MAG: hypothetical protein EZS28_018111 [Streblomastix strix]